MNIVDLLKVSLRIKQYLFLVLLLSTCRSANDIEGLWVFEATNGSSSGLMDIEKARLQVILLSDPTTGEHDRFRRDTLAYHLKNDVMFLHDSAFFNVAWKDDEIDLISLKDTSLTIKLRRLSFDPAHLAYTTCFQRAYTHIEPGQEEILTLDFINDTILLRTDRSSLPAIGYGVVRHKGYSFLKIFSPTFEWASINECREDGLILQFPNGRLAFLKPIAPTMDKKYLYGSWVEIQDDRPRPPLPSGLHEDDQFHRIDISKDSMRIAVMGHIETVKWDISRDGQYIYFIDRIFDPEGAWKMVHITDSIIVLNRFGYSVWEEEEIKLRRLN